MANIKLRPADLGDLALLKSWDEQPHVVASDPNDDWKWEYELGRSPHWRDQLVAMLDQRPIGFLQIIDPALEESHYWGKIDGGFKAIDIWIGEPGDLGRGYGTAIMRLALKRCFDDPSVNTVLIDPLANNTRAHKFYRRMGFQFFEERQFGQDLCHVYRLSRAEYQDSIAKTP